MCIEFNEQVVENESAHRVMGLWKLPFELYRNDDGTIVSCE